MKSNPSGRPVFHLQRPACSARNSAVLTLLAFGRDGRGHGSTSMASSVRAGVQRTERSADKQVCGEGEPERLSFTARLRRRIEKLGPYQSLVLLAVPACIVEPLKLVAVAVAGAGHWISGTITVICAYAA